MTESPPLRFMVGGVQKCGTTALHAYLTAHPGLAMSREKETHFFDRETGIDWNSPDYTLLDDQFSAAPTGALRGEATPITLYWTPAHARIFRYNPEMRFIFMFRPPAERAWSHWLMSRSRGLEPLSFSKAIREGRARVLDDFSSPMGLTRLHSYVERGYYGRQLIHLTSLFPKSQMLFLKQEDLILHQAETLNRIAIFLKISPFPRIDPIRIHVSPSRGRTQMKDADRTYLDHLYRRDQITFREMTGIEFETK